MSVRPIDANALMKKLKNLLNDFDKAPTKKYIVRILLSMLGDEVQTPTLDYKPVVHTNKMMTDKEIKTSYANSLLPKLKWAASNECKNLEYAQKRLENAITCIENLIDIIQFSSVETQIDSKIKFQESIISQLEDIQSKLNNDDFNDKKVKTIEPRKEILAYFTIPKDKVIEEKQNICFHISPKGNLLISCLNNDGHYESIDALSVEDFVDGMTMQNAEYFCVYLKKKLKQKGMLDEFC